MSWIHGSPIKKNAVFNALSDYISDVFDRSKKVNMPLDVTRSKGSDWSALQDDKVIEGRFGALMRVGKYVIIGTPAEAARIGRLVDYFSCRCGFIRERRCGQALHLYLCARDSLR